MGIRINGKLVQQRADTEKVAALIANEVYDRIKELEQLDTAAAKAEVKKISLRVRAM